MREVIRLVEASGKAVLRRAEVDAVERAANLSDWDRFRPQPVCGPRPRGAGYNGLLACACARARGRNISLVYRLLRSRHGLALSAIGDSEAAAESTGVDVLRTKFLIYVLTATATGMVGALIFLQKARISPDAAFSLVDWTAYVIFIVVIGGIGTMEGPIVGVAIFYLLQYYLAALGSWYLILLGALAVILMRFAPAGAWGLISRLFDVSLFPVRRRLIGQNSGLKVASTGLHRHA